MKIAVAGGTGTVGRYVASILRERGDEVVILSRGNGVDLVSGAGLRAALRGVDVVIDVASVRALAAQNAIAFFRATTTNLLDVARANGVGHYVALSIVGIERVASGYYLGKRTQEELIASGAVPWTILRATQFHEFAAQTLANGTLGPFALVPALATRPIAAREVAAALVTLALGEPQGRSRDLGGPRDETLVAMVRAYVRAIGARRLVVSVALPGAVGRALRDGALLPAAGAARGTQTFACWLRERAVLRPEDRA